MQGFLKGIAAAQPHAPQRINSPIIIRVTFSMRYKTWKSISSNIGGVHIGLRIVMTRDTGDGQSQGSLLVSARAVGQIS